MKKIIWLPLVYHGVTYQRFEVSSDGKIKNANSGHVYKTVVNKKGYEQLCVSLGSREKRKIFKVHRAVAETFLCNPDCKPVINHKDGNKLNNQVINLEWTTESENSRHAVYTGLMLPRRGSDNEQAKLTVNDVRYIREHYQPGDKVFGSRALARKFGVDHMQIIRTARGEKYANVC